MEVQEANIQLKEPGKQEEDGNGTSYSGGPGSGAAGCYENDGSLKYTKVEMLMEMDLLLHFGMLVEGLVTQEEMEIMEEEQQLGMVIMGLVD